MASGKDNNYVVPFKLTYQKFRTVFEAIPIKPHLFLQNIFTSTLRTIMSLWLKLSTKLAAFKERLHVRLTATRMMYNWSDEDRDSLLEWVRSKAPGCSVNDFSYSWKDGLILVALLEGIVPNSCGCSQYHLLNPKHDVHNVELAFSMAKEYLRVHPTLTPSEITSGAPSSEKKLIHYVIMLKVAMNRNQNMNNPPIEPSEDQDPLFRNQPCLAKGMGLMVARRGKHAKFNLYVKHIDPMDIIIAIRGPGGDFCSRRITNRSPRHHKSSRMLITQEKPPAVTMNINLEYEIEGRKISVTYIPLSVGNHQLSIYWQGRHLEDSPYTVTVDESTHSDVIPSVTSMHLKPPVETCISPLDPVDIPNSCDVHQFDNSVKTGKVIRQKILRQVVLRNGSEIELHEDKPLPYDPKAWCGDTCLSCQVEDDSRANLLENRKSENCKYSPTMSSGLSPAKLLEEMCAHKQHGYKTNERDSHIVPTEIQVEDVKASPQNPSIVQLLSDQSWSDYSPSNSFTDSQSSPTTRERVSKYLQPFDMSKYLEEDDRSSVSEINCTPPKESAEITEPQSLVKIRVQEWENAISYKH